MCTVLIKPLLSSVYNVTFVFNVPSDNCQISVTKKCASLIYQLATRIFHLLESELPADFQTKFGLSWNLLKASIGNERGNTHAR